MLASPAVKRSLKSAALAVLCAILAGCASLDPAPLAPSEVQRFSANRPGQGLPWGWEPLVLSRAKTPTQYDLVVDSATQKVVLHAIATRSASGLKQRLSVEPQARPVVQWRWRVVRQIDGADNADRDAEDAPVRLLLFFDGDKRQLPAAEQMKIELARLVSGRDMPYATLMYIWANRHPVGALIPSGHTARLQMIVAGAGSDRLGQWKDFERNYVEDFRHAFGEAPGRLIGVAVMTDTDNTGAEVDAFYGDIALRPAAGTAQRP